MDLCEDFLPRSNSHIVELELEREMTIENQPESSSIKQLLERRMLLSIIEASKLCGVSVDTIRRAIKRGDLPHARPGRGQQGKVMIRPEALQDWIKDLEERR